MEKILFSIVTGIALRSSNVTITHSRFERNNVGLISAMIAMEFDSDLVIIIIPLLSTTVLVADMLFMHAIIATTIAVISLIVALCISLAVEVQ